MNFSLSRPLGERRPLRVVPRRKPAPEGVTTATSETLAGPLDGVVDARVAAHPHVPIPRNPRSRCLVESAEPVARLQRHTDPTNSVNGTVSHLDATLTVEKLADGFWTSHHRGRKAVSPHPVEQRHHGKRQFYSDAPNSTTTRTVRSANQGGVVHVEVPHKKRANRPTDTAGLLRFSPRCGAAARSHGTAASACAAAEPPPPTSKGARQSDSMRSILLWDGPSPRNRKPVASHLPRPRAVASHPTEGAPQTVVNPPFDAPFRARPATSGDDHLRRARGTQRVSTRPKSARGLLSWVT